MYAEILNDHICMHIFFSLFLFALTVCHVCVCLFTNRCLCVCVRVCVCVSVLVCGSMSSGYTHTQTHTHTHTCPVLAPCAFSRMAFELGPGQSCALVDCHSSLNLLPDQSPPPSELVSPPRPPARLSPLLSPTLTLDFKPDVGKPCHHGHAAWHFGERGRNIVLRDRRDAEDPVEMCSL